MIDFGWEEVNWYISIGKTGKIPLPRKYSIEKSIANLQ